MNLLCDTSVMFKKKAGAPEGYRSLDFYRSLYSFAFLSVLASMNYEITIHIDKYRYRYIQQKMFMELKRFKGTHKYSNFYGKKITSHIHKQTNTHT